MKYEARGFRHTMVLPEPPCNQHLSARCVRMQEKWRIPSGTGRSRQRKLLTSPSTSITIHIGNNESDKVGMQSFKPPEQPVVQRKRHGQSADDHQRVGGSDGVRARA
jgi:hypothetical protein